MDRCVAVGLVWLSLASMSVARLALNHDEPPMVIDGKEVPFLKHYGADDGIDIVGEIREIRNFFPPEFLEKAHADLMGFTEGENQAPNLEHWLFTSPTVDSKLRSNENIKQRYYETQWEMTKAHEGQYRPGIPEGKYRVLYTKWELMGSSQAQQLTKKFWDEMSTPHSAEKLAQALGEEMGDVTHSFVSMFHKGDFLSTHAASRWEGRGEWAYIIYLSKDWKPEYGGSLYILNSTKGGDNTVSHVCVPEFNKMVLFKMKPNCPKHFVSQVRVNRPRLALTGWYSTKRQKDWLIENNMTNQAPKFLVPLNQSKASANVSPGVLYPLLMQPKEKLMEYVSDQGLKAETRKEAALLIAKKRIDLSISQLDKYKDTGNTAKNKIMRKLTVSSKILSDYLFNGRKNVMQRSDTDNDADRDGVPDDKEEDKNTNGVPDDFEHSFLSALREANDDAADGVDDQVIPSNDTDGDGVSDGDADGDGLPDVVEEGLNTLSEVLAIVQGQSCSDN